MVDLRLFQESTNKPTDCTTFCVYFEIGRAVVRVRCWVTGSECEVSPDDDRFFVNWLADELTNTLTYNNLSLFDATLSYLDDDDCHVE